MYLFSFEFWDFLKYLLGIIFSAITISIAYLNFRKSHYKKFTYFIASHNKLIGSIENDEKIKITFNDLEVENVDIIELSFKNESSKAIIASDFENNIAILFNNDAIILRCKVTKCKPENLKVITNIECENKTNIEPMMLNSQDSFSIEFIVSNYKNISIESRIKDVESIVKRNVEFTEKYNIKSILAVSFFSIFFLIFISNLYQVIFVDKNSTIYNKLFIGGLQVMAIIVLIIMVIPDRKK